MAVKEIVVKGHPALAKKSAKVDRIDDEVLGIIQDLKDTLHSTENGVGIAAPQIGINKRIIYIDLRDGSEGKALINPRIAKRKGKQESEEACLSFPGYYGYVDRPAKVMVRALNEKGEKVEYIADELLCSVSCHEIDHLEGVMYCDIATELHRDDEPVSEHNNE
jgi:peptide deformylase